MSTALTAVLAGVVHRRRLTGGTHHECWLAERADGTTFVLKTTPTAPPGMFAAEAEGLQALRRAGLATPDVYGWHDDFIAMAALEPAPGPDDRAFWAAAGRALAHLQGVTHGTFGWRHDNWLGPTRQSNPWCTDGYEFFVEHRLTHHLRHTVVRETLGADTCTALDRLFARMPDLVPPARAVLCHGDLWPANTLRAPHGGPAVIDPAVSYSWPWTDLAMMLLGGGAPPAPDFLDAYREIVPLPDDWQRICCFFQAREWLTLTAQGLTHGLPGLQGLLRAYA